MAGNTTRMDSIKNKDWVNLASCKVSVAKRLSFPSGLLFTIQAPFYACSC